MPEIPERCALPEIPEITGRMRPRWLRLRRLPSLRLLRLLITGLR
ncbi:MAG: hypothetical protein SOY69_05100 [Alloprevotella sp.]|nr:hypothetical protein [Alloprevotella sp.]